MDPAAGAEWMSAEVPIACRVRNNMRMFSVALAVLGVWYHAAAAAATANSSVRVATFELDGIEPSLADATASEEELKPLRQVAAQLKPLDADVIVLHGIPDRQVARRLAGLLKQGYQVALHSSFRQSGATSPVVGPPLTVLTRKTPFASRAMEWRTTGQIDWPGGFGFVGFHSGTNSICIYVAHLPGEPAAPEDREHPLMARRRDLAAQYLVHHANWLGSTLSNQLVSALITGDFIAEARGTKTEGAVRILQNAGFRMAMPSSLGLKTAVPAGEESSPAVRLTGLVARNADLISTAQVSSRKTARQLLASYEVAPRPTPASGAGLASSPSPLPTSDRVVSLERSIIWLWVGGIAALSIASLFSVWLIRRSLSAAGILGRRVAPSMVLDVSPYQGRAEHYALPHQPESYSGSTADALWPEQAAQAAQAQQRARHASFLGEALRPQLSRLLRERLVAWLSFQRGALLASHEMGTKQVLALEARLRQVQGQFQAGLRNREDRIAQLEQQVQAKEKIIRDLLRTQVRLANDETVKEKL